MGKLRVRNSARSVAGRVQSAVPESLISIAWRGAENTLFSVPEFEVLCYPEIYTIRGRGIRGEFKPSAFAQTLKVVSSRVTALICDKLPIADDWAKYFVGLNLEPG
jgi:hypothetical protein